MTRLAPWLPPLGFAGCLILSSANAVEKYLPGPSLLLYALAVLVATGWLWQQGPRLVSALPERPAWAATLALLAALTLLFAIAFPLVNAGRLGPAGDRDEAIEQATRSLLAGEYPYHQKTYLDNPISPLPGTLLLSIPFVLLDNGAWQLPAWLILFVLAARRWLLPPSALLGMLASLLLAPKLPHELITGSDLMANALYLLVAILWLLAVAPQRARVATGAASLFFGLTLASRANFLFLLPLVGGALWHRAGPRIAVGSLALAGSVAAAVTLPFWLYDPTGFSPLTTGGKLATWDHLVPYGSLLVPLAMGLAALALAARNQRGDMATLWRDAALIQVMPVLYGVLVPLLAGDPPLWMFGTRYGAAFLFFAAVAFWLPIARRAEAAARAPTLAPTP